MDTVANTVHVTVPNTVASIPGSFNAYHRLAAIDAAIALLPASFIHAVRAKADSGMKVVYYVEGDKITDATGTLALQAMAQVVE